MLFRDDNKVRVNQNSISTFIGADTKVEGTLITHSSVRIDGTVVGGVVADGTVVLSQSGEIQGNTIAENIVIAGVIDGNITVKDKTNIEPTGEVYGDISTSKILIDEQSVFQGKCNMNIDRTKSKKGRLRLKETLKPNSEADAAAKTEAKPAAKSESKPAPAEASKKEEKSAALKVETLE
ncbi:MAG: polymer-forming cytoskeletal protein [Lachnospiraceae bacterium]|nr:polymer-forming cytoskeletal protein [Lachnospiraceae bacterium]